MRTAPCEQSTRGVVGHALGTSPAVRSTSESKRTQSVHAWDRKQEKEERRKESRSGEPGDEIQHLTSTQYSCSLSSHYARNSEVGCPAQHDMHALRRVKAKPPHTEARTLQCEVLAAVSRGRLESANKTLAGNLNVSGNAPILIIMGSYKRVKGRSHTVEKRLNMHPHKPHAASQPSRLSHTDRPRTHSPHN